MKITIGNSDLDFLSNEASAVTSCLTIRVIQAAYRKYDLLKAIPLFHQIPFLKSLKYREIDGYRGSVFLIDDWRMYLRSEGGNEEQNEITITNIRSDKDEFNH